ncbi:TPA: iron-containing redox enzyme family protein [Providencia stuartii]|uniref:Uncharacterized protein n=4 Tax=Enterobacterales TaxID=91347 RepID=A0AA86YSA6_PROST|nr:MULTISPECIES: iron-containing redox enzyme family protein [Providencia]EDU57529.1 hypothetical protein PROSTU_04774 [Providencia stuartii ATCC 25827]SST03443.1 Pyrroloquinoline quinone (Coenzyme PQQ) biosynthesis protein C [Acinetobacter baumannii]AMG68422.1 iron-containing redox enzyme family protein [Providencia stuartii]APG51194.1 hypothetical protein BGK56_09680 [Providencia stuartii]AVL38866.1 iron-containing redox enzyme family protein [Providencia stuartii]
MSLNIELKNQLESSILDLNLPENPYFKSLTSGEMTHEQFLNSQLEFASMVYFFSRPMAQIIANISDPISRIALVGNLWEEHGQGIKENVHGNTILTLIERLGGDISSIDLQNPPPNARIFNEALRGVSAFCDFRFAASMYAGIERTFVDVSCMIFEAITKEGWLPEDKITHYGLHRELDIEHSEDFLKVVNQYWDEPKYQFMIKEGIKFGCQLFANAYVGFYRSMGK